MGPKRGRLLIRQPRVKRDSDSTASTSLTQKPTDIEIDVHQTIQFTHRLLPLPDSPHSHAPRHTTDPFAGSSGAANLTTQHHGHHLSHPVHIFHPSTPSSSHLLTVPGPNAHTTTMSSSTPYLIKQHSHPLLPSQSSLDLPSVTSGHHSLHRQMSYPTTSSDNMNLMMPLSGSLSGASSIITDSAASSSRHIEQRFSIVKMEDDDHHPQSTSHHTLSPVTPSIVVVSEPMSMASESPSMSSGITPTISSAPSAVTSGDVLLPSIRIKGEELQRSISSPLVRRKF